jgi:hypothetical protein
VGVATGLVLVGDLIGSGASQQQAPARETILRIFNTRAVGSRPVLVRSKSELRYRRGR